MVNDGMIRTMQGQVTPPYLYEDEEVYKIVLWHNDKGLCIQRCDLNISNKAWGRVEDLPSWLILE